MTYLGAESVDRNRLATQKKPLFGKRGVSSLADANSLILCYFSIIIFFVAELAPASRR
jgi:hypothetical protein